MFLDDIIAIHRRLSSVPVELRATATTYGLPVVTVTCKTEQQARLIADFIKHARADMCLLLKELGERKELEQAEMEL